MQADGTNKESEARLKSVQKTKSVVVVVQASKKYRALFLKFVAFSENFKFFIKVAV